MRERKRNGMLLKAELQICEAALLIDEKKAENKMWYNGGIVGK